MIANQFNTEINIIRSDNELEYEYEGIFYSLFGGYRARLVLDS